MQELNLMPKKDKDSIKDLLIKKRDMAMKGEFKLPKMRHNKNRQKRNGDRRNYISTVQEDDEEGKSSDSNENTSNAS